MDDRIERAAAIGRGRHWASIGRGRRIRERMHLPLSSIADACGVSRVAVLRWERGQALPHGDHAVAYAELIERLEARLRDEHEEVGA